MIIQSSYVLDANFSSSKCKFSPVIINFSFRFMFYLQLFNTEMKSNCTSALYKYHVFNSRKLSEIRFIRQLS